MLSSLQPHIHALQHALDSPTIPWKPLVLVLLSAVYLFESYLSLRQYRLYRLPTPPAALATHVSLQTFQNSQAYGRDKARFAFVSAAISHLVSLAIIYFDVYAFAWHASARALAALHLTHPHAEIPRSLGWIIILFLVRELPALPLSLYRHFVVEQRHGFNKMTLRTFASDTLKEWMLGLVIGAPLMAALLSLIRWAGDAFVTYVVAFLIAFQIVAMLLYPTVIQPLFNKLTPLPEGELRDRVVALAASLRFPLKHLYQIDGSKRSSHSNAYFFGVVPGGNKHIVIFDTLIETSTPDEIEAVLAHELGHWAHRDPTKLMVLSQLHIGATMSLFALFIHNRSLFEAFGFGGEKVLPVVVGLELFQLVLNPSDALVKFGMNAAVRSMEYAADAFAAGLERPSAIAPVKSEQEGSEAEKPEKKEAEKEEEQKTEGYATLLQKALIKLHINNLSSMHHDPLFSAYHYSHPTLVERLVALDRLQKKRN
ncbi:zinc metalloprotease [Thecaphora frezii]